jgi:hypothetical protein
MYSSQRSPKRRRVEFGRASSDRGDHRSTSSFVNYQVPTTMSGFTKASNVPILQEQSINTLPTTTKEKSSNKSQSKVDASQSTLHGFLGKPKPPPPPVKAQTSRTTMPTFASSFNRPRVEQARSVIDPELSQHKVVPRVGTKPKIQHSVPNEHSPNEYPFLSSSPTRKSPLPEPVELPPLPRQLSTGLTNAPQVLEYMKPPSIHMTSLDMVKSRVVKKSLGMRRSGVPGWSVHQPGKFKPPTMMKRPP